MKVIFKPRAVRAEWASIEAMGGAEAEEEGGRPFKLLRYRGSLRVILGLYRGSMRVLGVQGFRVLGFRVLGFRV